MGRFRKVDAKKLSLPTQSNSEWELFLRPQWNKYIFQLSPLTISKYFTTNINISDMDGGPIQTIPARVTPVFNPNFISGLFWRNNNRAKYVNDNKWVLVTVPAEDEEGYSHEDKEVWINPQEWEITNVWEDTQFNEPESWATQDLGKIFDDYDLREPIQGEGDGGLGNSWLFNTLSPHRWPDIILDHHEGKVLYGDKKVIDRMKQQLGLRIPQAINKEVVI